MGPNTESASDYTHQVCMFRIRGLIDAVWATRFPGFTLVHGADGNTTFTGSVVDQAALHGVLSRVRDLGLVLLSVQTADSPER